MEHLHYVEQHRVWICITCRHAVWPQEIIRHFRNKKKHDVPKAEQQQIREKILGAPYDAVDDPDEFIMPSQVIEAIPHLTLHEDGYRCCVEDCHTIRSSVVDIRKHCRTAHNQTIHRHRGKPTTAGRRAASTRRDQMWRSVARYQRFFASREHSQYFEVRPPARIAHAAEASDIDQRINTEIARIQGSSQRAKEEADRNIEPGEVSDANQWLERAQFAKYLSGYEWETLMALVDRPETEFEPVEYIMWKAMDGLGRFSQRTVREKAGVFVRFEAVRSEKHQTRYQPLMAYQDEQSFSSYVRPWQQIIMFFARTRTTELRQGSPQYRFNRRQSQAWERFVHVAEDVVARNQATEPVTPQRRRHRSRRRIIEDDETDAEADAVQAQSVEEQQELEDVQRACLQFCIALMDCPASTQHHEYEFAMVRAMAVLGVKTHGWKGPDQYPPIISRVIKIARFMVVQQAWEEVQPMDVWDDEGYRSDQYDDREDDDVENGGTEGEQRASPSNSQDSAIDVPVPKARQGVIEVVRDMMDRFMVRGSGSPMQWLLDLRTYGLKIHYNTTAPGSVRWSGANQLGYKGMEIGMDAFRGFVHGLEGAARTQLQAAVLMGHTPPVIPWQNMRDNPSETEVRFNFLQSEQWVSSVDGGSWLWQRVQGNAEQREQWFHADSGHIRRRETIEWMDVVEEFRMQLLLLMHITGGQPARAPEILSIHHENRSSQQLRNVFLEDGLITFVTRYHKGYMMSGDVKIIHRYLPREVGEMFVWYLWLVLPFYNDIDQHFQREDEARRQRMEHPDPNEMEENGRISPAADGQEATATPQRNTPRRGPSTRLWPASHRKQKMTSARMREGLKRYSRLYLGEALTIASYREVAIAISRKYMGRESAFVTDLDQIGEEGGEDGGEDGEGSIGKRLQAIIDQQAGHTSHTAGMIYARLVGELQGSVADVRQGFRKASEMWHTWLGFASADRHSEAHRRVHGRKRGAPIESPWQGIQQQARRGRETWLRQAPIEDELQRMIGPEARFRGIQEAAMLSIIRGDPRIVAVMPTGGGKSILFQLPAFVTPGGLTIVVVPITELRAEMMQRCVAVNIVAQAWEDGGVPCDRASIVLITPESAAKKGFGAFMDRQRDRIDRIVIDECHVILNRQSGFRREMPRLGGLVRWSAQMVLITATLPPSRQTELFRRMYWTGLSVTVHRMRTVRPNIQYRTYVVPASEDRRADERIHREAVVRIAEAKRRQHQPGKIIVYAESTDTVRTLADTLGVGAYFSDAHLKGEMFQDFRSGREQMIVATNALGLGIDIPDIRVVIHADTSRCLEEFGQESGRAGRDGRTSESIAIVRSGQRGWTGGHTSHDEADVQALVERFVQNERGSASFECRRRVLCEYMDGYERVGCEAGEEPCDVCAPSNELQEIMESGMEMGGRRNDIDRAPERPASPVQVQVESSRGMVEVPIAAADEIRSQRAAQDRQQSNRQRQEAVMQAESDGETFQQRVRTWQRQCPLCAANDKPAGHGFWQCRQEGSTEAKEAAQRVQKAYRLEQSVGCHRCIMPFSMCDRWVPASRPGMFDTIPGGQCRHSGVIIAGWIGVLYSGRGRWFEARWREDVVRNGMPAEEAMRWEKGGMLMQWVGKRVTWNDTTVCEFAQAFSRAIARLESIQQGRENVPKVAWSERWQEMGVHRQQDDEARQQRTTPNEQRVRGQSVGRVVHRSNAQTPDTPAVMPNEAQEEASIITEPNRIFARFRGLPAEPTLGLPTPGRTSSPGMASSPFPLPSVPPSSPPTQHAISSSSQAIPTPSSPPPAEPRPVSRARTTQTYRTTAMLRSGRSEAHDPPQQPIAPIPRRNPPSPSPTNPSTSATHIQEIVDFWKDVCVVCRNEGLQDDHGIYGCSTRGGREIEREKKGWGITIQGGRANCTYCYLPRTMCKQSQGPCPHREVAKRTLIGMQRGHPQICRTWLEGNGFRCERVTDQEMVRWMGSVSQDSPVRIANIIRALVEITEQLQQAEGGVGL